MLSAVSRPLFTVDGMHIVSHIHIFCRFWCFCIAVGFERIARWKRDEREKTLIRRSTMVVMAAYIWIHTHCVSHKYMCALVSVIWILNRDAHTVTFYSRFWFVSLCDLYLCVYAHNLASPLHSWSLLTLRVRFVFRWTFWWWHFEFIFYLFSHIIWCFVSRNYKLSN